MLASKSSFPASLATTGTTLTANSSSNMPPSRRAPAMPQSGTGFASPTNSEFSDTEGPDAVKNWTEDQVCEYLRSVRCGEYEKLFRKNNINGENLLEMDKDVLKEMGIEKVGDRVRLFLGIKKLRTKAYANVKKRNRVSAPLELTWTVLGGDSPRSRPAQLMILMCGRIPLGTWNPRSLLPRPAPRGHRTPAQVVEPCRRPPTKDILAKSTCQALA